MGFATKSQRFKEMLAASQEEARNLQFRLDASADYDIEREEQCSQIARSVDDLKVELQQMTSAVQQSTSNLDVAMSANRALKVQLDLHKEQLDMQKEQLDMQKEQLEVQDVATAQLASHTCQKKTLLSTRLPHVHTCVL